MKKIILTVFATLLISSSAVAGGFTIGATGALMNIEADGSEKEVGTATKALSDSETNTGSASNDAVPILSFFAEYSFDDTTYAGENNGFTIGYSMIPGSADIRDGVAKRTDVDGDDAADDDGARSAQAEIENHRNIYVEIPIYTGWYAKLGHTTVDVNTLEGSDGDLGTYGNAEVDGLNAGIGYKGMTSGNMVWKVAYEQTDFDTISLTSSTGNSITADVDTAELNVSIGYRF